jgi:NADPH:quinone reductase-like Zn-dependent oxidoreductase
VSYRHDDLATLSDLIAAGSVTPVIDRAYPLSQAGDALRHVGDGHTRGKVVIQI